VIGLVAVTDAGRAQAARLGERWPDARLYDGRAADALPAAFTECTGVVAFMATGIAARVLAPLLRDKTTEPGVVCVDEGTRYAVALVGGHEGGANALAARVAHELGCEPVVTTASETWDARDAEPDPLRVSVVLGIGASRGVSAAEVLGLVDRTLADEELPTASVVGVASVDAKRDEAGLLEAAQQRGWPVTFYPAAELADVDVPNPSEVVRAAVGTPSVAEAAALRAAGPGAELRPKRKSAMATVAVAVRPPRGRLALVGLGPGARDLLTPRATDELRRAAVVVGLDQYVDQVRDLLPPTTRVLVSRLGDEEERARAAVDEAVAGHCVALIGSGDAGVYAMASPALDFADERIDVVVVPGVTAALAASASVGSALGHDHCAISLSDLHTPWPAIEARVRAAAEGDFVVSFYNPRSAKRDWQLPKALAILRDHRPGTTPAAIVTNASRDTEETVLSTLDDIDVEQVGMYSLVLVGSSQSRYVAGRFVTPRGYTWAG
jgi:cobalt-precorrin 5A hydrolase/precorrin-3B C17-methyltransferase